MRAALTSFLRRPHFWPNIILCLGFPVTSGLVERIEPFFLIDPVRAGGLGLTRDMFASLYASVGFGGLIVGATLGSMELVRRGLEKSMWRMGMAVSVPGAIYLLLALTPPAEPLVVAAGLFAAHAFHAYGMVGYVVFLQRALAPGAYPTTHYNLASGLKALTMMSSGAASGYLQGALGYPALFAIALGCGIAMLFLCRRRAMERATGED